MNRFLLLIALVAAAPTSILADECGDLLRLQEELLYYEGRKFGRNHEDRLRTTESILTAMKQLSAAKKVAMTEITLHNRKGEPYPALQITPSNESEINLEAARVHKELHSLPLVFSPYDLGQGIDAFYDPNGTKLGVPIRLFFQPVSQVSSYQHELYHAGTLAELIAGRSPLWAGVMRVREGQFLSSENRDGYSRFSAMDELVTTALSLKKDIAELIELFKSMSPEAFRRSDRAFDLLKSIYGGADSGSAQAQQLTDLLLRAESELTAYELSPMLLKVGQAQREITQSIFKLDTFNHEIVESRGMMVAVPDGGDFSLYWATPPQREQVEARLNQMQERVARAFILYEQIKGRINMGLELPEFVGTDFGALEQLAAGPYQALLD